MKKILICLTVLSFISTIPAFGAAPYYYQAPNEGNMNFYPMMQRQMEREETLDFINNPEDYKQRREEKDAKLDYQEGKTNVNPYLNPTTFNLGGKTKFHNEQPSMEFTKDENGQIKIQGIK